MTEFAQAVVFGKFWPLHRGHEALLQQAAERTDHLLVFVNDGNEEVPATTRVAWVRQLFPAADVRTAPDLCGHDTTECNLACSTRYARWLEGHADPVNAVFSGDAYGELLAAELGATWVRHDRSLVPTTGRLIRADLPGQFNQLTKPARAYYARRVVLIGAESTGTTTLSAALSSELGVPWVAEYGRAFTEEKGLNHEWELADFENIALAQTSALEEAAARSVGLVIGDTDALATSVWCERYVGDRSPIVEGIAANSRPHLYLLTSDDIPFVQDGLRDGEHLRAWMTQRFREVADASGVPWIELRGSHFDRLATSLDALESVLEPEWVGRTGA